MRDRRCNDFHPRHHWIERGREKIAAAGDRRTNNNNSIMDGVRSNLAGKHRGRTDRSQRAARAIESDRQRVINQGLSVDERVVVTGIQRVRPGINVKPTMQVSPKETAEARAATEQK